MNKNNYEFYERIITVRNRLKTQEKIGGWLKINYKQRLSEFK